MNLLKVHWLVDFESKLGKTYLILKTRPHRLYKWCTHSGWISVCLQIKPVLLSSASLFSYLTTIFCSSPTIQDPHLHKIFFFLLRSSIKSRTLSYLARETEKRALYLPLFLRLLFLLLLIYECFSLIKYENERELLSKRHDGSTSLV